MTDATFGDLLAGFEPAGPPNVDERRRREDLASFLRTVEPRVFQATGDTRDEIRSLLGWDDESLEAFVSSEMIVHSATHVSMNAFAPMLTFPWVCQRLLARASQGTDIAHPVHLRTQVTHNNLSDSRWKPHVWWRVTDRDELVRTQLFSRGPQFEHRILVSQPPPRLPADLAAPDTDAAALAAHATNYAYSAMIHRMAVERHAGLHAPYPAVEIPIDLLNLYTLYTLPDDAISAWSQAMRDTDNPLRSLADDDELHEVESLAAVMTPPADPADTRTTLISTNFLNVGYAYRLGLSVTMGAEKMTAYLAEMNGVITDFLARVGEKCRIPQFLGVSRFDIETLAPVPPEWSEEVRRKQGKLSLPLFVARHGTAFGDLLDVALDRPLAEVVDAVSLGWGAA